MARRRKDLGARRHSTCTDAPWIECAIVDLSEEGACVEVGALVVPDIFGLAFSARGELLRGMLAGLAQRRMGRRPFPEGPGSPEPKPRRPTLKLSRGHRQASLESLFRSD